MPRRIRPRIPDTPAEEVSRLHSKSDRWGLATSFRGCIFCHQVSLVDIDFYVILHFYFWTFSITLFSGLWKVDPGFKKVAYLASERPIATESWRSRCRKRKFRRGSTSKKCGLRQNGKRIPCGTTATTTPPERMRRTSACVEWNFCVGNDIVRLRCLLVILKLPKFHNQISDQVAS